MLPGASLLALAKSIYYFLYIHLYRPVVEEAQFSLPIIWFQGSMNGDLFVYQSAKLSR